MTIFFSGLTLISIGLIDFWMNISFSVREFVLKGFCFVFAMDHSRKAAGERTMQKGAAM